MGDVREEKGRYIRGWKIMNGKVGVKKDGKWETHVNIHKLATILTPNSLLDDGVLGHELVDGSDAVKREANAHEVEEAVHEETTFCQYLSLPNNLEAMG